MSPCAMSCMKHGGISRSLSPPMKTWNENENCWPCKKTLAKYRGMLYTDYGQMLSVCRACNFRHGPGNISIMEVQSWMW
jgi:hypothetical protein